MLNSLGKDDLHGLLGLFCISNIDMQVRATEATEATEATAFLVTAVSTAS